MAEPDNQTPPNLPKGEAFRGSGALDSPSFGGVGEVLRVREVSVEEGKLGYVTANPGNYIFIKEVRDILKENPTKAEELIWEYLRNKKTGHKIRRQHIISDFITDFVCLRKKVVIEIDGDIHLQQLERDEMRTQILNDLGYKVVRFPNEEVFANIELVVKMIKDILDEPDNQTPPNLPKGEAFEKTRTLLSPSYIWRGWGGLKSWGGHTKLNNDFFENKLKAEATTRNWRTTQELLNIAEKLISGSNGAAEITKEL